MHTFLQRCHTCPNALDNLGSLVLSPRLCELVVVVSDRLAHTYHRRNEQYEAKGFLRAVEEEDVSVPTLILCGAEDGLTKQQGASVVMNFSNAGLQGEHVQCRIIARASYMLPWEKGVGESVAGFIDGLPLVQAYGTSA